MFEINFESFLGEMKKPLKSSCLGSSLKWVKIACFLFSRHDQDIRRGNSPILLPFLHIRLAATPLSTYDTGPETRTSRHLCTWRQQTVRVVVASRGRTAEIVAEAARAHAFELLAAELKRARELIVFFSVR